VLLLLLAIACLAVAAFLVGEVATLPARERQASVKRAARYGQFRLRTGLDRATLRERVFAPLAEWLAAWALRAHPRSSVEAIGLRLMAAGLGRRITPKSLLAIKGALAFVGVLGGALVGGPLVGAGSGIFVALMCAACGFFLPDAVVTLLSRRRRERIASELPDALDLLAVSVEAGLGFDGAISKLTEHMEGPLADEFALTLSEMRIGESRQAALKRLATRAEAPEVGSFTRAIIQADQLGTSLGRILRVQAADARLRRQAAAEERAMKAPIKMLFPTVLFIFPAMFLVILGPALLNIAALF
jgi:tight adherence protein C